MLWLHVPVVVVVAMAVDRSPVLSALAAILLAGAYHLTWWRHGTAPVTRYLSAVALMGEPALLVYLLAGHSWQMDIHMYFFATLALTIARCDWRVILVAAITIAVHHLLLDLLLPSAVFSRGADTRAASPSAATGGLEHCFTRPPTFMLTRYKGSLRLKDRALAIAKRSNKRKARIALARRLARSILDRLRFRPSHFAPG